MKLHEFESTWCHESICVGCFTNTYEKSRFFTSLFRIWKFQTNGWKWYFQIHLEAERFVDLRGEHWDFLKEGVKIYLMAPMSPLNLSTFSSVCCTSIVFAISDRTIHHLNAWKPWSKYLVARTMKADTERMRDENTYRRLKCLQREFHRQFYWMMNHRRYYIINSQTRHA